jgi:hypothetical protein
MRRGVAARAAVCATGACSSAMGSSLRLRFSDGIAARVCAHGRPDMQPRASKRERRAKRRRVSAVEATRRVGQGNDRPRIRACCQFRASCSRPVPGIIVPLDVACERLRLSVDELRGTVGHPGDAENVRGRHMRIRRPRPGVPVRACCAAARRASGERRATSSSAKPNTPRRMSDFGKSPGRRRRVAQSGRRVRPSRIAAVAWATK